MGALSTRASSPVGGRPSEKAPKGPRRLLLAAATLMVAAVLIAVWWATTSGQPAAPPPVSDPEAAEPLPEAQPEAVPPSDAEPEREAEPDVQADAEAESFLASTWDVTNTGYRASGLLGTDLERVDGELTTSQDGEVIEGVDVDGGIVVAHRDVTIRDSRVRHWGRSGISVAPDAEVGVVTIENVEIDGQGNPDGIGIDVNAPAHVSGVRVHGQRTGMNIRSDTTLERSYIHGQAVGPGTHNTAASAHGATGLIVRDNRLESSTSASLSLYPRQEPIRDVLVTANLFEGTGNGIGLYAGDTTNHPYRDENRDIRIIDNRWTGSFEHGTHRSWNPEQPGSEWSGNVWHDSGEAVE
jgi:hypothetical protein